eukprot:906517-Lingulodinium_polyedra.AAC.1
MRTAQAKAVAVEQLVEVHRADGAVLDVVLRDGEAASHHQPAPVLCDGSPGPHALHACGHGLLDQQA